jgi:hypothetical protein
MPAVNIPDDDPEYIDTEGDIPNFGNVSLYGRLDYALHLGGTAMVIRVGLSQKDDPNNPDHESTISLSPIQAMKLAALLVAVAESAAHNDQRANPDVDYKADALVAIADAWDEPSIVKDGGVRWDGGMARMKTDTYLSRDSE